MGRSTIQIGDEVRYWDELTPKERHDIWEVMAKRIGKTIEEYVLANPDQYERVKAGLEWAAEHPWGKPKQEDNTAKSE